MKKKQIAKMASVLLPHMQGRALNHFYTMNEVATDASIELLMEQGFNPFDYDEESVFVVQSILEAGYLLGRIDARTRGRGPGRSLVWRRR